MKKILSTAIIFLFLASTAQAKVTYKNSVLNESQLNTIKGLLYDMSHSEEATNEANKEQTQKLLPYLSKSIVWLMNRHNSSKTYRLESARNKEAKLIINVVATILDVMRGKYPGFPAEKALGHWTDIGSRVSAEYKTNPKQTVWKFELKPEDSKTQNLVFRHEAEIVEVF